MAGGSPAGGAGGSRPRIVVAGGGIAGAEALLALHHSVGEAAELTLVAPEPELFYRPLSVEEPVSLEPARRYGLDGLVREAGATLVARRVDGVDVDAGEVALDDGSRLPYDRLVVCVGGRFRQAFGRAMTIDATREAFPARSILAAARDTDERRVTFVIPPGTTWPLPAYELALITEHLSHEPGRDPVEVTLVTPESGPLIVFGHQPSDELSQVLEARGIEVHTDTHVTEAADGTLLTVPDHETIETAVLVSLPVIEGPALPGLPADEHGFIPIDEHARVEGARGLYAAGDGTDFPVKQGGIATQQADAAAEHIAANLGLIDEPRPFHPVLRGQLITGVESIYMRHDLTGGHGDGIVSSDYLWWPPHKVSGRYLAAWLAHEPPREDPDAPEHPLDVEVSSPSEWHGEPLLGPGDDS